MEINVIKQKICTSDSVFTEKFDLQVENEFIMPDYCGKIKKILKCFTTPRIITKNAGENVLEIEGILYVNLLYLDESDAFQSFKSDFTFHKKFNIENINSDSIIKCTVKNDYINCKVLNERKFNVSGNLGVCVSVKNISEKEIINDVDNENFFIKQSSLPAVNTIGNYEKSTILENEIELTEGQKSIKNIVSFDGNVAVLEVKTISDKIITKANLNLKILYIAEDDEFQNLRTTIPFSQIIDIPGNDNCKCNAEGTINKLDVFIKKDDDFARSMQLSAKVTITAECYCEEEIMTVADVYSTERDLEVSNISIFTERLINVINDNYMFTDTFDFSDGAISGIVDIWYNTYIRSENISEGNAVVNGTLTFGVLAYDTDGKIGFYEKSSDFSYKKPVNDIDCEKIFLLPVFTEITTGYTIISDSKLEIKVEYSVNIGVFCRDNFTVLNELTPSDTLKKRNTDSSMIVYFSENGESIWDISKKFNANINTLREINDIDKDNVEGRKKIFIPLK